MALAQLPFFWVDTFTRNKLSGNPCAVILNSESLTPKQMLNIAQEINLSETAFVHRSKSGDFYARYFTPLNELPFAGHPTVAVAHILLKLGLIKNSDPFKLFLPAGPIGLEVNSLGEYSSSVKMQQLKPIFMNTYRPSEVLPIFNLQVEDLLPGALIQTVSTGIPILIIPLKNQTALKKVKLAQPDAYNKLVLNGDFLFPHHFILEGATPEGDTFARSLALPPSTAEDPFTGSANGCMAAFILQYGFLSKTKLTAQQGHWMGRPGQAQIEVILQNGVVENIFMTGEAHTIIEGQFLPLHVNSNP